jgi:hypothetical protein
MTKGKAQLGIALRLTILRMTDGQNGIKKPGNGWIKNLITNPLKGSGKKNEIVEGIESWLCIM